MSQTAAAYRAEEHRVSQDSLILDDNQAVFLDAWKDAVTTTGCLGHFHARCANDLERATHWRQMAPDLAMIRKIIANKSQADAAFLALLASLYNETEGQKMLDKTGTTLGKLPLILSRKQHGLMIALLTHYRGW